MSARKHNHARGPDGKVKQSPTYTTWREMKRRCLDPGRPDFRWYGARGVQVTPRWLGPEGFLNFLEDLGERPDGHTLDRVDSDGHYEPENCQWLDLGENCRRSRGGGRVAAWDEAAYGPAPALADVTPKWPELVVEPLRHVSPQEDLDDMPF